MTPQFHAQQGHVRAFARAPTLVFIGLPLFIALVHGGILGKYFMEVFI
jgi:hypothetical protein